jgi:predicted nucleotidyltransferase
VPWDNAAVKRPVRRPVDATELKRALEGLSSSVAPEGVLSVYLYGSHAAGRAHRESDVDVGVLLAWDRYRTARARFQVRVRLSAFLAAELGESRIDVVTLNDVPPQLGRHIVTTGCRVFCSDVEADHAFRRDVQLRAADLEPFLRRTRLVKLAALAR